METPRTQRQDHVKPGREDFLLEVSSRQVASGRLTVAHDGTEEGELTEVTVSCEQPMEQARPRKRGGRKKKAKAMDHSGLEENPSSVPSVHISDEPTLCLPMKRGLNERSPHEKVVFELGRCLQEHKHLLLSSAVQVMGVRKALKLFHQTTEIQLSGGEPTADGKRKKTPGGVFLTLVRKSTSDEERKRIFNVDKKVQVWKKKEKQRQRIMAMEARISRLEELEAEEKCLQQTRQERNTEKRFPVTTTSPIPPLVDEDNNDDSATDEPADREASKDSLMQKYWKKSITALPKSPVRLVGNTNNETLMIDRCKETDRLLTSVGSDRVQINGSMDNPRVDVNCVEAMEVCFAETDHRHGPKVTDEDILAQQFDLTDEADLDFGIDFG